MKAYQKIAAEIAETCAKKNEAYGDSFSKAGAVLALLYPNGVQPSQYGKMLAVVRIVDKLFRVANQPKAFGESPGRDISGYGLLMAAEDESGAVADPYGLSSEGGPTSLPLPPKVPQIEGSKGGAYFPATIQEEMKVYARDIKPAPEPERLYKVHVRINNGFPEAEKTFEHSVDALIYYDSFKEENYTRYTGVRVYMYDPKGARILSKVFEGSS